MGCGLSRLLEASHPSPSSSSVPQIDQNASTEHGHEHPFNVLRIGDFHGHTPRSKTLPYRGDIILAVKAGKLDAVGHILAAKPEAISSRSIWRQNTVWHVAAERGDAPLLSLLVDFVRAQAQSLVEAEEPDSARVVLQDSLRNHLDQTNQDGATPLILAAMFGKADLVMLLVQHGSNIWAADHEGFMALHWAVRRARLGCVRELLERPAPVQLTSLGARYADARANDGVAPLHFAVAMGHHEVVVELLAQGANPLAGCQSCLGLGLGMGRAAGATPLHVAAGRDDLFSVQALLLHFVENSPRRPYPDPREATDAEAHRPYDVGVDMGVSSRMLQLLHPERDISALRILIMGAADSHIGQVAAGGGSNGGGGGGGSGILSPGNSSSQGHLAPSISHGLNNLGLGTGVPGHRIGSRGSRLHLAGTASAQSLADERLLALLTAYVPSLRAICAEVLKGKLYDEAVTATAVNEAAKRAARRIAEEAAVKKQIQGALDADAAPRSFSSFPHYHHVTSPLSSSSVTSSSLRHHSEPRAANVSSSSSAAPATAPQLSSLPSPPSSSAPASNNQEATDIHCHSLPTFNCQPIANQLPSTAIHDSGAIINSSGGGGKEPAFGLGRLRRIGGSQSLASLDLYSESNEIGFGSSSRTHVWKGGALGSHRPSWRLNDSGISAKNSNNSNNSDNNGNGRNNGPRVGFLLLDADTSSPYSSSPSSPPSSSPVSFAAEEDPSSPPAPLSPVHRPIRGCANSPGLSLEEITITSSVAIEVDGVKRFQLPSSSSSSAREESAVSSKVTETGAIKAESPALPAPALASNPLPSSLLDATTTTTTTRGSESTPSPSRSSSVLITPPSPGATDRPPFVFSYDTSTAAAAELSSTVKQRAADEQTNEDVGLSKDHRKEICTTVSMCLQPPTLASQHRTPSSPPSFPYSYSCSYLSSSTGASMAGVPGSVSRPGATLPLLHHPGALKEAEKEKEEVCAVCMSEWPGVAMSPCDHALCGECARRLTATLDTVFKPLVCPFCRGHIRKYIARPVRMPRVTAAPCSLPVTKGYQ